MDKLSELRKLMKSEQIDTYIITKFDPHQSEYAAEYFNGVKFISGFTGSAATVVVTHEKSGLWTDGRYYIQAERELSTTEIELYKEPEQETISIAEFCRQETKEGGSVGFDGRTMSKDAVEKIIEKVKSKNIDLKTSKDLLNEIWKDRAEISKEPVFEHSVKYAGKNRLEKISEVRQEMAKENADLYIISSLDDIAWLFNLRGCDIPYLTVFFAYAAITKESAILFIDETKLKDVKSSIVGDKIEVKDYNSIYSYLETLDKDKKIIICPERSCYELCKLTDKFNTLEIKTDITTILKAMKNETEIKNTENAYIKDGVAMVKFLKWLKESVKKAKITEYDVMEKLRELRAEQAKFVGESFDTIAAYMSNGAMMHYSAKKDNCALLQPKGFLLVDSGGHYLDGTTDITRTIALGELKEKMKIDFTLTLKSVINLSMATFLYGTTGTQLDTLARMPMWENYMDYKCGTGHGVGFCLNVHEGPHAISPRYRDVKLEKGMITTNEPGVYIEGEYGIRTENTMVVEEVLTNNFGKFMNFRTLSYCPIDIDAIDQSMLKCKERTWINEYHKMTYEKLSPYLSDDEKAFLKHETRELV